MAHPEPSLISAGTAAQKPLNLWVFILPEMLLAQLCTEAQPLYCQQTDLGSAAGQAQRALYHRNERSVLISHHRPNMLAAMQGGVEGLAASGGQGHCGRGCSH